MVHIVILNWNGWKDTLECLDSLCRCKGEFKAYIVDNGSTDESVEQISHYIAPLPQYTLIQAGENLGFAKGNNHALRQIAPLLKAEDRVLLLNNDTIVEPDFLEKLESFNRQHPEYQVLTPLICYNYDRSIVWNCGGWQRFGLRKYYYARKDVGTIRERGHIQVTFLTGCALYATPSVLQEDSSLLTEDYFFGEEDFEFCLRMNQAHIKMACVLDSKIYHKVGTSTQKKNAIGKHYIHYLNRYIDIRKHSTSPYYFLWSNLYALYVFALLRKQGFCTSQVWSTIRNVIRNAKVKNSVTHEDFINAISGK